MAQRRSLGGRYELTSLIGRGGMGEVWAGYDTRLDRRVAVKLLRPETLPTGTDAQLLAARFTREARLTARLEHSGVPAVFDAGSDDGDLYLVMQLVAGRNLADVIAKNGALPVDWAIAIAAQVATVLTAAHAVSLVHRDLKPRNIMLGPDGMVTVLDFGVAALLDPELTALTVAGETLGSPAYMAPEQALHGTAGPPSDLYSLGCVLHELIAGQQLFTAEVPYALMHKHVEQAPQPLRELRAEVPAAVEQLVLELLAKVPERRPSDALAVHQRLLPFLARPGSGSSSAPALMDPTQPYRFPLDSRRYVVMCPPAEVGPAAHADVEGARLRAQRLVHQGRFTQAAEILAEAVAAQTCHGGDTEQLRELRLDLASALILGGDYRSALPEYRALIAEFTQVRSAMDEIVLHCRNQAAICSAEIGDVSTALRDFRSLLADQQRVLTTDDDQLIELRRQIALLEASSGDVSAARRALGELERDLQRLRGLQHPEVRELGALLQHLRKVTPRRR